MNLETRKPGIEFGNVGLTDRILAAAVKVHTELGPGYLEGLYEEALAIELTRSDIPFERQKPVSIFYCEQKVGEHRLDILVAGEVIVELKAISALENIHFAIVRSYLKATGLEDGLLLNFASVKLVVKRVTREYRPRSSRDDITF